MQQEKKDSFRELKLCLPFLVGSSLWIIQELARHSGVFELAMRQNTGVVLTEILKNQGFDIGITAFVGGLLPIFVVLSDSFMRKDPRRTSLRYSESLLPVYAMLALLIGLNFRFFLAEVSTFDQSVVDTHNQTNSTMQIGTGDSQDAIAFASEDILLTGYGVYTAVRRRRQLRL